MEENLESAQTQLEGCDALTSFTNCPRDGAGLALEGGITVVSAAVKKHRQVSGVQEEGFRLLHSQRTQIVVSSLGQREGSTR
eukprot:2718928-Rhodomonas_salina.1